MKRKKTAELLLELDFPNERVASSIYKALDVEIKSSTGRKADLSAELKGRYITIKIASTTSSSLRAVANSYLRWIYSMSETLGVLGRT